MRSSSVLPLCRLRFLASEGSLHHKLLEIRLVRSDRGITSVKIVHNVEEGGKLVAVLVVAVHAVGDGDKVNAVLQEEYLRIKAGLQSVVRVSPFGAFCALS